MLSNPQWPSDYQEQFWELYPRRVAKKSAMVALDRVRKSGEVSFAVLLTAVACYANSVAQKDMQYVAHPATWLNAGRWDDDPKALGNSNERPRTMLNVFDDLSTATGSGTGPHPHRVLSH